MNELQTKVSMHEIDDLMVLANATKKKDLFLLLIKDNNNIPYNQLLHQHSHVEDIMDQH
jgi:hypothetical protein